jgi:hypothetical protein
MGLAPCLDGLRKDCMSLLVKRGENDYLVDVYTVKIA